MKVDRNEKPVASFPRGLSWLMNRDQNLLQLGLVTVGILILMSVLNPGLFLTKGNFEAMAYQLPEFGLLAIGIMASMLIGGIDLSVVGISNLSGILAALVLTKLLPKGAGGGQVTLYIALATVVAMVTGTCAGYVNGLLITRGRIPDILATLGTMELLSGICIVITKGAAVLGFPDAILYVGNGTLLGIPVPLFVFALFAAIIALVLSRTPYGFEVYMLGTNPTAARFSGINNAAIVVKTYMLSGFLASIAGLVVIGRTNAAKAGFGSSYTLQAIVVAVLGGVNPSGGFGTMAGLVLALLSLQFLSSGFNMLRIGGSASNYAQEMVWGIVLLLVMVLNYLGARRKGGRQS